MKTASGQRRSTSVAASPSIRRSVTPQTKQRRRPTLFVPVQDERLAAQLGVSPLLDRDIERVHVGVNNLPPAHPASIAGDRRRPIPEELL